MNERTASFTRYLPLNPELDRWGWRLVDAGRQWIRPQADYPDGKHPLRYLFDASGRRVLDEYQVVFIARGRGTFESCSYARTELQGGDAVVLFPGEWHRYSPAPECGWQEYWIGFNGPHAERVMAAFFAASQPLYRGLAEAEVVNAFERILQLIRHPVPGGEQISASWVTVIVALLRAARLADTALTPHLRAPIEQAMHRLMASGADKCDLRALARELGMSYSLFRSAFKDQTGYAPREFENRVKLNRARELLRCGQHNVSTTAALLGYSSVYYFSRAFTRAFGESPQKWLARVR